MFYKPKFCSDCGEKVERAEWKAWTSRRFCELCETEHKWRDWLPRVGFAVGVLAGIFVLGTYLQKPEKPLNIIRTVQAEDLPGKTEKPGLRPLQGAVNSDEPAKPGTLNNTNKEVSTPLETQNEADDNVYYCGAATKKGIPCKRLVKGGGRCWQHLGKPAILPAGKLAAGK